MKHGCRPHRVRPAVHVHQHGQATCGVVRRLQQSGKRLKIDIIYFIKKFIIYLCVCLFGCLFVSLCVCLFLIPSLVSSCDSFSTTIFLKRTELYYTLAI